MANLSPPKKVRLSKEDIGALEVIADRKPEFKHKLNTDYINIHWVLDSGIAPSNRQTLSTIDRHQTLDDIPVTEPLLSSPRSAYVVLKNGMSVKEMCAVPVQQHYNQGLLDGVSVEVVKVRIASEETRRANRFKSLVAQYDELCAATSLEEVVEAVRDHKFGLERAKLANVEAQKDLVKYVSCGKQDLTVLDSGCVDVLVQARHRSLNEVRRVLQQRERVIETRKLTERSLMQQEREKMEETKQWEQRQAVDMAEKKAFTAQRVGQVKQRVKRILEAHKENAERAVEIIEIRRQQHQERLAKTMVLSSEGRHQLVVDRRIKHEQKKKTRDALHREKMLRLEEQTRKEAKLKEYEISQRRKEVMEKSAEFARQSRVHQERARTTAEQIHREKMERRLQEEARTEQKFSEFDQIRQLRHDIIKDRAEIREMRRQQARGIAKQKQEDRIVAIEQEHEVRLRAIETVQQERDRRLALLKEHGNQSRVEKTEEQHRTVGVTEFNAIGYIAVNNVKTKWMETENEKRKTLITYIRQEREAMNRARDQLRGHIEDEEIARQKREAAESASIGLITG